MNETNHTNRNLLKIQQVIDEGNQPLYKLFNNEKVGEILSDTTLVNTPYRGQHSQRSLQIPFVDRGQDLALIFCLDHKAFGRKYIEAISGDGQEGKRIRTLHSSSLLCLLCFYGVSKERPLVLVLDGEEVTFTESCFEVKNPVGVDMSGHQHNSNIDVMLVGANSNTGRRVILFLESKFSEYLAWSAYSGISKFIYGDIYAQLSKGKYLDRMGLKYKDTPGKPGYYDLMSKNGNTLHYAGGIKQMISHYLGLKNVADSTKSVNCDIYLGEILFRFDNLIDPEGIKLKDYTGLYEILAEGLNNISESKLKVINKSFTYQDVFRNYPLDNAVRAFYSL